MTFAIAGRRGARAARTWRTGERVGDPTAITAKHGARLLEGELFATSSRIEWAVLLQCTFGFDSLRCPKCHARMRLLATVTDPGTVNKILTHLGVRTELSYPQLYLSG